MWFGLSMFPKKRWSFEPKFDAGLQGWPQDRGNSASLSSNEHSFVPGSAKNRAALWAVARDQRFKLCCPHTPSPSQALPPTHPLSQGPAPVWMLSIPLTAHLTEPSTPAASLASWKPDHPQGHQRYHPLWDSFVRGAFHQFLLPSLQDP